MELYGFIDQCANVVDFGRGYCVLTNGCTDDRKYNDESNNECGNDPYFNGCWCIVLWHDVLVVL